MNKSIILAIVYFLVFIIGGYFFYTKYFYRIINPDKGISVNANKQKGIYYSVGNNLYQLNPEILTQGLEGTPSVRFQSTGKVSDIAVDKENKFLFYNTITPQNTSEIWKVYIAQNSSEKSFSNQTPGLENFNNFRSPLISPDNQKMAFLSSHNNIDYVFVVNILDRSISNLTNSVYSGTISSIDWSLNSQQVVFASTSKDKSIIKIIDLNKGIKNLYESGDRITKITYLEDKIIFLSLETKNNTTYANINSLKYTDKVKTAITDIAYPKQVVRYSISPDNQFIVYETLDLTTQKTDLYEIKTNGTDLLQLSFDGKSVMPLISPESNRIAFWIKGDGIFLINLPKTQQGKILNTKETIDKMIIWK